MVVLRKHNPPYLKLESLRLQVQFPCSRMRKEAMKIKTPAELRVKTAAVSVSASKSGEIKKDVLKRYFKSITAEL